MPVRFTITAEHIVIARSLNCTGACQNFPETRSSLAEQLLLGRARAGGLKNFTNEVQPAGGSFNERVTNPNEWLEVLTILVREKIAKMERQYCKIYEFH